MIKKCEACVNAGMGSFAGERVTVGTDATVWLCGYHLAKLQASWSSFGGKAKDIKVGRSLT